MGQRPRVLDVSRCHLKDAANLGPHSSKVNRGAARCNLSPDFASRVVCGRGREPYTRYFYNKSGAYAVGRKLSGIVAIALLSLAGAQAVGAANLYRWTDSEGNPVISDRPPPHGVEFETISTRSSVVERVQDENSTAADAASEAAEAEPERDTEMRVEVEPKASIYKKNPENCKRARDNLEILELPRIRIVDENGEGRFLTEEEREEQRNQAREAIAQSC